MKLNKNNYLQFTQIKSKLFVKNLITNIEVSFLLINWENKDLK